MEILLVRLTNIWLIFLFTALTVKFYKLALQKHRSKSYYDIRYCMAFMFANSALVFIIALFNTFYNVPHYGLHVGCIMTIATLPIWFKVQ